ncbi:putative peptidoglycan binding domain protein [compost metagenome]
MHHELRLLPAQFALVIGEKGPLGGWPLHIRDSVVPRVLERDMVTLCEHDGERYTGRQVMRKIAKIVRPDKQSEGVWLWMERLNEGDYCELAALDSPATKKHRCRDDAASSADVRSVKALRTRIAATLFKGALDCAQANCIGGMIAVMGIARGVGITVPMAHLAYVLATVYHETATTMRPIEEYGKGAGLSYGEPDPETGQTYYGRGYVQLTWRENYEKASQLCFDPQLVQGVVDFVQGPDRMLVPFFAAQAALFGMRSGWFTGKALADYDLPDGSYDYINARRIINGTDCAELIAGYAHQFEEAGRLAVGMGIERAQLAIGAKGSDVLELQLVLGLPHDGVFGGQTEEAVKAFQREYGLQADGVVGQAVWDTIDREVYGL